jgi:hypothetical protein
MLKAAVVILVIMLAYGGIFSLMNIIVPKTTMIGVLKATTHYRTLFPRADKSQAWQGFETPSVGQDTPWVREIPQKRASP